MAERFKNFEIDDFGKSIITTDDKGIIVEAGAIHHKKYIGKSIDEAERDIRKRREDHHSKKYQGIKDLPDTLNSRLIGRSDIPPEAKKRDD